MNDRMLHPPADVVLAIQAEVLAAHGGSPVLRSRELLEAALAAPQAERGGVPRIADPIEIAAGYMFYLCRNGAFAEGSQRVGLATCLVFLSENGLLRDEELDVDAWKSLTLEAAAGVLSREEVTQRLRGLVS
jgi:death-on-curing protein